MLLVSENFLHLISSILTRSSQRLSSVELNLSLIEDITCFTLLNLGNLLFAFEIFLLFPDLHFRLEVVNSLHYFIVLNHSTIILIQWV